MRADGAHRVDDGCPDAGRLTVRRPHHVPVAPRFRHGVERVDAPSGKAAVAGVSGRSRAGAVRSETRAAVTASKAGRFFRSPAAPDPPAPIRVPDPACGTGSPSSSACGTGPARWPRTRRRPPPRQGAPWSGAAGAGVRRRPPGARSRRTGRRGRKGAPRPSPVRAG